jgi:hypothetical protein
MLRAAALFTRFIDFGHRDFVLEVCRWAYPFFKGFQTTGCGPPFGKGMEARPFEKLGYAQRSNFDHESPAKYETRVQQR